MKGIIFKVLESTVLEQFGEHTWDQILGEAAVPGVYTSIGNYEDAELLSIINALPPTAGQDQSERLRWFGQKAIPALQQSFPHFFEGHNLRSILPTLNHAIHPEVRKLYPGANPPVFELEEGNSTTLTYRSERGLCHLAEGFILGSANLLRETISINQTQCMHRGDEQCDIVIDWD